LRCCRHAPSFRRSHFCTHALTWRDALPVAPPACASLPWLSVCSARHTLYAPVAEFGALRTARGTSASCVYYRGDMNLSPLLAGFTSTPTFPSPWTWRDGCRYLPTCRRAGRERPAPRPALLFTYRLKTLRTLHDDRGSTTLDATHCLQAEQGKQAETARSIPGIITGGVEISTSPLPHNGAAATHTGSRASPAARLRWRRWSPPPAIPTPHLWLLSTAILTLPSCHLRFVLVRVEPCGRAVRGMLHHTYSARLRRRRNNYSPPYSCARGVCGQNLHKHGHVVGGRRELEGWA